MFTEWELSETQTLRLVEHLLADKRTAFMLVGKVQTWRSLEDGLNDLLRHAEAEELYEIETDIKISPEYHLINQYRMRVF